MWGVILSCALLHNVFATEPDPITIEGGRVQGFAETLKNNHVVHKYLGIRYARAERFERPRPARESWTGVKEVKTFGKVCYQSLALTKPSRFKPTIEDMDEDCLNLNVYVPAASSSNPRAVMFWIHGGGFIANSNRISDGSYLATLGDVIVVTINYRLGVLGFLHHRPSGLRGNYGLFDQLEALKWVNRNIAAFGGDPNRVTIFGNSAGGASVSFLCLSPLARNLFKYTIMQSGVSNLPFAYQFYKDDPNLLESYKKNLKCTNDLSVIDCLKSVQPSVLFSVRAPPLVNPVVDGEYVTDSPITLLDKGMFTNPDSTMIGVASDDGSCLTNAIPELSNPSINIRSDSITRQYLLGLINGLSPYLNDLSKRFKSFVPFYKKAVIQQYSPWANLNKTPQNRRMILDLLKDSSFIAPSIYHANAFVENGAKVFFYHVDYGLNMDGYFTRPSFLKAYHETEKFMVFGFPLAASQPSAVDVAISENVIKMWSNFAKTGDPNPYAPGGNFWPEYDPNSRKYLSIEPNLRVKSNLRPHHMAFWNDFLPSLNKTAYESCVSNPESSGGSGSGSGAEAVSGSGGETVSEDVETDSVYKSFPFLGLY